MTIPATKRKMTERRPRWTFPWKSLYNRNQKDEGRGKKATWIKKDEYGKKKEIPLERIFRDSRFVSSVPALDHLGETPLY
jgi:hypothetical protein